MNAETYLMNLKVKLAVSSSIQSVEIVDERIVLSDRGYFRARLVLANGDFLEISEYFVCQDEDTREHLYKAWIPVIRNSQLPFHHLNKSVKEVGCVVRAGRCLGMILN